MAYVMSHVVKLALNVQSNDPYPLKHASGCLAPLRKLNQYIFGVVNSEQMFSFSTAPLLITSVSHLHVITVVILTII